jgi:C-terminal processing protease CtpA/Prc
VNFHDILERLAAEGRNTAGIIDLRGNPGGSLDQCFAVIEELVADGVYANYEDHYYDNTLQSPVIVYVSQSAAPGGLGENTRWVFLADENSASAAEILLSAVIDCLDTKVIGKQTYGKGLGQYYIETLEQGLASISALKFYNKNWVSHHGVGIAPHIKEEDPDMALEKAAAYINSLRGARRSAAGAGPSHREIQALNSRLMERRNPSPGGSWRLKD